MKSRVSLALLLLAAACTQGDAAPAAQREKAQQAPRIEVPPLDTPVAPPTPAPPSPPPTSAVPPEAGNPAGPSGTAGNGAPTGYDAVGYASWYGEELDGVTTAAGAQFQPQSISIAHRTLPLGSVAEVTSLDSGRTILALVGDRGPGRTERELDLSRGAAQLLGMNGRAMAPVRVRSVVASPADTAALRAGRAASPRLDAPEPVLRALRRQLPKLAGVDPTLPRPTPPVPPASTQRRGTTYAAAAAAPSPAVAAAIPTRLVVQVGTFSSEDRARKLARSIRGFVEGGGGLWRVKTGPYGDMPAAQRARDAAVARGYADAAILVAP